ncbi:MAG: hypothetical protein LWW92_00490 [Rhodocyclales bacterium]|nr:hypothetical protein [Rhodocyclales bacterium]
MQKTTHLLLLDDTGARLVLRGEAPQPLPPPPAGPAQLARLLESTPRTGWRWLVERRDEYAIPLTLPLTKGADRLALLERQQRQLQLDTCYHTPLEVVQRRTQRPEEDLLLCGLADPAPLKPWLEVFERKPSNLLGIHTPTLLYSRLSHKLPATNSFRLIIRPGATTLRMGLLSPTGRLCFSRNSPYPAEADAQQTTAEVAQFLRYLRGQKILPHGLDPHLILLHDLPGTAAIPSGLETLSEHPLQSLGPQALATAECPSMEALFLQLTLQGGNLPDLRPQALRQRARHQRLAHALRVGSLVVLGCSMIHTAQAYWHRAALTAQIQALQHQNHTLEGQAQALLQTLPHSHPDPEQLTTLEHLSHILKLRQQATQPLLERLAQTLEHYPELTLYRLQWNWPPLPSLNDIHPETLHLILEFSPHPESSPQAMDQLVNALAAWPSMQTPQVELAHPGDTEKAPLWRITLDVEGTLFGNL